MSPSSRCANCQANLSQQSSYQEFTAVSDQNERSIRTDQAIATIFEGTLSLKQKIIPPETNIEMCFQCISILAELFRFYTEFLEMSHRASYIGTLIEESIVWRTEKKPHSTRKSKLVKDPLDPDTDPTYQYVESESSRENDSSELDFLDDVKCFEEEETGTEEIFIPEGVSTVTEDAEDEQIVEPEDQLVHEDKTKDGLSITRITRSMTEEVQKVLESRKSDQSSIIKRRSLRKPKSARNLEPPKLKSKPPKKFLPQKANTFKCYQCKETFSSQQRLELHCKKMTHTIELTCLKCNAKKVYKSGRQLRRHLLEIHGDAPVLKDVSKRTCAICSKVFNTPYQMKYHTRFVHVETKDFQCVQCEKRFATDYCLQRHIENVHTELKTLYPCDKCELVFRHKQGLLRHVSNKHVEEDKKKGISCDQCGKEFTRPDYLKHHMNIHSSERSKSATCPTCKKSFYDAVNLKAHMKTHDGQKEALCTFCGEAFLAPSSLKRHIHVKHTDEQQLGKGHTCHVCGKEFKLREYLLQHLRAISHGGDGHTAHKRKIGLLGP